MSDDKGFLLRWSRRKRQASAALRGPPAAEAAGSAAASETAPNTPLAAAAAEPPSVGADLPPIETIGAGSDIRAFLAPGVPADLVRSALRRAWTADPSIRDFIGLSENSWDFNAPDGVPGFGSVTAEDARRLLARVSGASEDEVAPTAPPASPGEPADRAQGDERPDAPQGDPAPTPVPDQRRDVAMQQESGKAENCSALPRRHGGALPE
jgi:hypothetical protein